MLINHTGENNSNAARQFRVVSHSGEYIFCVAHAFYMGVILHFGKYMWYTVC